MNSSARTSQTSFLSSRQPKLYDGTKTRSVQAVQRNTRLLNAVPPPARQGAHPADSLGLALLEEGVVTLEDIRQHLADSEGHPGFIQLLLHCPMVSKEELAALLASRYRVPVLNLDAMKVPPGVIRLLPSNVALALECLPVARIGELVCMAVADIRDRARIRSIRAALGGAKVKVFPSPREMLQRHLTNYYCAEPTIEEVRPLSRTESAGKSGPAQASASAVKEETPTENPRPEERKEPQNCLKHQDSPGDEESILPPSADSNRAITSPAPLPAGAEVIQVGTPASEKEATSSPAEKSPDSLSEKLSRLNADEDSLTEEELEELLTAMAEESETSDDSFLVKADEVSLAEYETGLDCPEEAFLKRWERIHFSHSPVRAEPVELGIPEGQKAVP